MRLGKVNWRTRLCTIVDAGKGKWRIRTDLLVWTLELANRILLGHVVDFDIFGFDPAQRASRKWIAFGLDWHAGMLVSPGKIVAHHF